MRGYLAAGRTWHILALSAIALFFLFLAAQAEPSRMVDAGEILKKIELGQPVDYQNVIVTGDLDLNRVAALSLPAQRTAQKSSAGMAVVASPISITNSIILNDVNFSSVILENVINFQGTKFNDIAKFSDAQFRQEAKFERAQFNQTADFSGAQFERRAGFFPVQFRQDAIFTQVKFNQTADFKNVQFNQKADFVGTWFQQNVLLWRAKFDGTVHFNGAQFIQTADFKRAEFNQSADFLAAQFNQTARFSDTKFRQYAEFRKAEFKETALFDGAQFNKTARFSDITFHQYAEFSQAQFIETANFERANFNQESNFENAIIGNAIFNHSQFSKDVSFDNASIKDLSLKGSDLEKLDIRWSSIHDLAYDDSAYNLLRKNLDARGYLDDASDCEYSYRCKHRADLWRQGKLGMWSLDFLAWASYGYGLKPQWPLYWSISLILLGGLFFFSTRSVVRSGQCPGPSENKSPAASDKGEETPGSVSIWESLLLSATYFTSGASSIISATHTEIVPVGRGRYVVVLLRLLGWIFFVIFLSSLTRAV